LIAGKALHEEKGAYNGSSYAFERGRDRGGNLYQQLMETIEENVQLLRSQKREKIGDDVRISNGEDESGFFKRTNT